MKHPLRLLVFISCCLVSRANAVTLRYQLREGDVLRYQDQVNGTGEIQSEVGGEEPIPIQVEGQIRRAWKVLKVERGPIYRLDLTAEEGLLKTILGTETQEQKIPPLHLLVQMDDRGYVLDARPGRDQARQSYTPPVVLGLPLDLHPIFNALFAVGLPGPEVKVGEEWVAEEMKLEAEAGEERTARAHLRLRELLPHEGQPCAKIEAGFELPVSVETEEAGTPLRISGRMKAHLTVLFARERGVMLQAEGPILWDLTFQWPEFNEAGEPASATATLKLEVKTRLLGIERTKKGSRGKDNHEKKK